MQTITLLPLGVAIVSDRDYAWLATYTWHRGEVRGRVYAYAHHNNRRILMHRLITEALSDEQVDHENGDGLDNRRENLRKCTGIQNQANRGPQKNNRSGFKGVSFSRNGRPRSRPWYAQIQYAGRNINLGKFANAEEAAKAYDNAAIRYFGDYAILNYPF